MEAIDMSKATPSLVLLISLYDCLVDKEWVLNQELVEVIKIKNRETPNLKVIILDEHTEVEDEQRDALIEVTLSNVELIAGLRNNSVSSFFYTPKRSGYYKLPNPGLVLEAFLEYELPMDKVLIVTTRKQQGYYKNIVRATYCVEEIYE